MYAGAMETLLADMVALDQLPTPIRQMVQSGTSDQAETCQADSNSNSWASEPCQCSHASPLAQGHDFEGVSLSCARGQWRRATSLDELKEAVSSMQLKESVLRERVLANSTSLEQGFAMGSEDGEPREEELTGARWMDCCWLPGQYEVRICETSVKV